MVSQISSSYFLLIMTTVAKNGSDDSRTVINFQSGQIEVVDEASLSTNATEIIEGHKVSACIFCHLELDPTTDFQSGGFCVCTGCAPPCPVCQQGFADEFCRILWNPDVRHETDYEYTIIHQKCYKCAKCQRLLSTEDLAETNDNLTFHCVTCMALISAAEEPITLSNVAEERILQASSDPIERLVVEEPQAVESQIAPAESPPKAENPAVVEVAELATASGPVILSRQLFSSEPQPAKSERLTIPKIKFQSDRPPQLSDRSLVDKLPSDFRPPLLSFMNTARATPGRHFYNPPITNVHSHAPARLPTAFTSHSYSLHPAYSPIQFSRYLNRQSYSGPAPNFSPSFSPPPMSSRLLRTNYQPLPSVYGQPVTFRNLRHLRL